MGLLEIHQQRVSSSRPSTTSTTTTPSPETNKEIHDDDEPYNSAGYPQHYQPQAPFSEIQNAPER